MHTLIKHLKNLKVNNILYVHESGELNTEFLYQLNAISKSIWILVLTSDRSINRYENRSKFEIIYNRFNFFRVNIFATGTYNHIFKPTSNMQKIIFVEIT